MSDHKHETEIIAQVAGQLLAGMQWQRWYYNYGGDTREIAVKHVVATARAILEEARSYEMRA